MEIKKLEVGTTVRGTLGIVDASILDAKNGKYLNMVLSDGTDTIPAKMWQYTGDLPQVGAPVNVVATVGEYKGTKDLNVKRWTYNHDVSPNVFRPACDGDPEEHYQNIIDTLKQNIPEGDDLLDLALHILDSTRTELLVAPAAKTVHHNTVGGLVQHLNETLQLAVNMYKSLPVATKDVVDEAVLLVAAALHDIGKLDTYQWKGLAVEVTDKGKLFDHIYLGAHILQDYGRCHWQSEESRRWDAVVHCVLAHHGKLEWGSPVLPQTLEAQLVHNADNIGVENLIRTKAIKEVAAGQWTAQKVWPIGRTLFRVI